ncbi:MAG: metal-dependent transcriptional regulator [Brumimicrobium sp.]|nr:metal-dependent transcriptional regulator [Brumimicrobium sp.]
MEEHLTQSEENYIKAIFALQEETSAPVSTNDLADKMETKASSVTDMVKKLAEKSLISYKKYKGCELTAEGERTALKTIRKHRLWETFLVEKLKFGWDEVHEVAEQLEHIRSTKLTDQLEAFLDFPKFDPHGDAIPDRNGEIVRREKSCKLYELNLHTEAVVIGVADGSPSFLRYLDKHRINLGTKLKVTEKFEFDDSLEVELNDSKLSLSSAAATNITVQLI